MHSGSTRSLRPSGIGHYFNAAILSAWLVGWIMGEVFAITMLGVLFSSIARAFPEHLPAWSADLVTTGGAAFALLFLLFWLTLWTVGGIAALTQVMRSLAGEDVIGVTASGFELVRRAGPFRRRYAFDRSAIRRLRMRPHDKAVVADTAKGTRVITTFGLPAEREAVADWLSRHLGLSDADPEAGTPPATWEVQTEGEVAYVRKVRRGARFTRSLISWLLTAGVASAWYASLDAETSARNIPALVLTLLLAAGAAMSTWGRRELTVRHGELMFRRSFAMWTTERAFRSARLELTHETDSDNDSHYKLIVTDAAGSQTVHSQAHDSGEVVDLARWLAGRTGFRLTSAEKLHLLRGRRTPSA
jgi:hypothetical protein